MLRGDLGRRRMRGLQAVGDFRFGRLRCCLVEIGETATLQLDPLNDQQLTALQSMMESTVTVPGAIVKLLAVMKDGTVEEAQFLKEKLCGPNRKPIKPLTVRFTSRNFHPPHVFAPKPAEEPVQPTQPVEPAPVEPGEPDVEMSEKSAEEPDAEMTEKPADEDLESTAASSGGAELWEVALGGSTARFSVDGVSGVSMLGHERIITPVKEDLAAFKAFRHQGLRDLLDGQFLLSARLWNESVTKASSPTVSATASEAPAEPRKQPRKHRPRKPRKQSRRRPRRKPPSRPRKQPRKQPRRRPRRKPRRRPRRKPRKQPREAKRSTREQPRKPRRTRRSRSWRG